MKNKIRRVVVTGMEAITSLGKNKYEMWENMSSGVDGIYPITGFDVSHFPIKVAATIDYSEINCPDDDKKWLKNMPKSSLLFQAAANSAIRESRLFETDRISFIDKRRFAVITGIPGNRVMSYHEFKTLYPLKTNREIIDSY
ncbi:MAG: hypothetical protein JSV88_09175, partial [Candidatus Aminicenantes bacterium]